MNRTSIEWTHRPETGGAAGGFTWNPIRARLKEWHGTSAQDRLKAGTFCTRISPGCTHCYASTINKRFGNGLEYTVPNLEKIEFYIDEKILEEPLRRKKPATIFVGDMFDLFHESIPDAEISYVFATIHDAPQHTFQLLTKRADRMLRFVHRWGVAEDNIWLGVSVESPDYKERIDFLRNTPAVLHYLSVEPLLSDIGQLNLSGIEWVICGGESGNGARPMHPQWVRDLRDECAAAKCAFFFKQWGEWMPHPKAPDPDGDYHGGIFLRPNGQYGNQGEWWDGRAQAMDRVGKNSAGAVLDGREWREFPSVEKLVAA